MLAEQTVTIEIVNKRAQTNAAYLTTGAVKYLITK